MMIGSFAEDRSLTLSTIPSHSLLSMNPYLMMSTYNCSSEWRYSGTRHWMDVFFLNDDKIPTWWYPGKLVQIGWETHDCIGIIHIWDSSEENETLLSQAEGKCKKKSRAEFEITEHWEEIGELNQTSWSTVKENNVSRSQRTAIMLTMEE